MTRHPLERAVHQARWGCLAAALWICAGLLFLTWPLLLGMYTDASGIRQVRGWTWAIEIPWLLVALVAIAAVRARARRRR